MLYQAFYYSEEFDRLGKIDTDDQEGFSRENARFLEAGYKTISESEYLKIREEKKRRNIERHYGYYNSPKAPQQKTPQKHKSTAILKLLIKQLEENPELKEELRKVLSL